MPRARHGEWVAPTDRTDPLAILALQATTRVPELVPIRYGRMAESAFAFYRGAAAVMAADMAHEEQTGLETQLCGDAHLMNFGTFAAPDRTLLFDVNDFDETIPGPFEWDIKRLAASLEIAARSRNFDPATRTSIVAAEFQCLPPGHGGVRRHADLADLVLPVGRPAIMNRWGSEVTTRIQGPSTAASARPSPKTIWPPWPN